jgi:dolichyl-phosphate beta-glucosyltransferase
LAKPYLSIVIPAYNEAKRLPVTLMKALEFFEKQAYPYELIIAENGSQDQTLEVARSFSQRHSEVRVLHETRRGKGNAVRAGMLIAQGEYRFMADADFSMPVEEISRFLPPTLVDFDVAIASREAMGSIRYQEPAYRHLGGRLINAIIRLLALPGLHDTQCGFKCFRAVVAEDLFRNQTMTGWSFDIELLYIARLRNYRVVEVPINWYYSSESKVNAVQDALRMVADILQIRRNARRGMYDYPPKQPAAQAQSDR